MRGSVRYLEREAREIAQKPAFQVHFNARSHVLRPLWKTLSHCKNSVSGSRSAARKTTRWCAARANTPTISTCPARPMPGSCAPAMPMASSAVSTQSAAKAMPGVLGVWTGSRPRRRRLRPLHLRPAAEEPRRLAAAADQPHRADDRQGALCRRSRRLRGGRDAGAGARRRRSRRSSISSRCPP